MEGFEEFQRRLEGSLESRRAYLDTQRLPQLKESFRTLQTQVEGLLNILTRKGLLREDPYKYSQRISEIEAPADDPFPESEKTDEMSYRLSGYRTQLDHLNTYYQFSVAFFDLPRLKRLSAFLSYIPWRSLSETAKSPTTRALSQFLGKIRAGSDTMAASIVKDSLIQMEKVVSLITSSLAEVVSFHRESFKCELRKKVLPHVEANAEAVSARRDEVMRAVKRTFAQALPGQPYYPELVEEVLEEDFGPDAESLRQKLLDALAVKEQKREEIKKKEDVPHKELLLEAVSALSRIAPDLGSAVLSLADNQAVISARRRSLGERIRQWLERRVSGRREEQVYEVEYFEGDDAAPRSEKISFIPFVDGLRKKNTLLSSLANRASGAYQKMEAAGEDALLEFVSRQLAELNLIYRRMGGLATYFQSEVSREQRQRLKGIKIELAAIKNGIVKANQKKHEYVSRKEEEEQMRRLGIH
jgi:hypothetical protein